MKRSRAVSWSLALLLFLVLLSGCKARPTEPLEAVPYPELSAAEADVRRQLGEGREALEKVLGADSSQAEQAAAFGSLGQLYHAYDLAEAAMACYRNAHRLAPKETRWLHLLGVLQRLEGEPEKAAASFRAELELDDTAVPAWLHLAALELDLENPEQAAADAKRALALEPRSAAALAALGKAASARGDFKAAAENFERALEIDPAASRLHYMAGQAYRQLGDLDAARRHLAQQGQGEASFADPRLAELYTSLAGSAALMQRAAKAEVAGQLEASVEIYRQAVAKAPRSPEARRDLGALLARIGRYAEAADQYREAVRLEPERGLNHFVLGLVVEQVEDSAAALEHIARAVEVEPDYREFRVALASRLAGLGRSKEALEHLDLLLDQQPGDLEARLDRAKVRLELQDAAGAQEDAGFAEQRAQSPRQRAEALAILGTAAGRLGDRVTAVAKLEQALALADDLAAAHFELANLAGIAGDFDQAAQRYRRVTELEPERVTAWLGEATALVLGGRESEAAARLGAGSEANPDAAVLSFATVRLLISAKDPQVRDPEAAVEVAKRLLAKARTPENGDLLVMALASAGRVAEAIALQRQLLDAMPENANPQLLASWRARLAELEASKSGS